jgi:RNA polymerase sigma factor (sigma-70 family)
MRRHRNDPRERNDIVVAHLPLVRSIASRYTRLGVPAEDLAQEGVLGLLEAIDRYEPERSDDFEAYARFRIRRAIRKALTEQSRLIRLPKQVVDRRRAVDRADALHRSKTGRAADPDEIEHALGVPAAAVVAVRSLAAQPLSLDAPVLDDGSTLESVLADPTACDPEALTLEHERETEVHRAVDGLPSRQRAIVERHFGLGSDAKPIAEVAADLHVTPQRARAIEREALYALRGRLER